MAREMDNMSYDMSFVGEGLSAGLAACVRQDDGDGFRVLESLIVT